MTFGVSRMYHPSHRVTDLDETERFFREVFGRYSTSRAGLVMSGVLTQPPDYPRDYCTFTPIADVFFDSIDPSRYVVDGVQCYESITEPYLDGFGWAVEGIEEIYGELRRHGIRCTDQRNVLVATEELPHAAFTSSPLFWTLADDTGLRYEFYPSASIGKYDPRTHPTWRLPDVIPEDPLGIERSSHHTVLTNDLERALRLVETVLGGRVVHQDRNGLLGTASTYVLLAGDILEYARPLDGATRTAEVLGRRLPLDAYHSITWKVRDLDAVEKHLTSCRIRIQARDDVTLVTDPRDSIGIPFGFTSVLACSDDR